MASWTVFLNRIFPEVEYDLSGMTTKEAEQIEEILLRPDIPFNPASIASAIFRGKRRSEENQKK